MQLKQFLFTQSRKTFCTFFHEPTQQKPYLQQQHFQEHLLFLPGLADVINILLVHISRCLEWSIFRTKALTAVAHSLVSFNGRSIHFIWNKFSLVHTRLYLDIHFSFDNTYIYMLQCILFWEGDWHFLNQIGFYFPLFQIMMIIDLRQSKENKKQTGLKKNSNQKKFKYVNNNNAKMFPSFTMTITFKKIYVVVSIMVNCSHTVP